MATIYLSIPSAENASASANTVAARSPFTDGLEFVGTKVVYNDPVRIVDGKLTAGRRTIAIVTDVPHTPTKDELDALEIAREGKTDAEKALINLPTHEMLSMNMFSPDRIYRDFANNNAIVERNGDAFLAIQKAFFGNHRNDVERFAAVNAAIAGKKLRIVRRFFDRNGKYGTYTTSCVDLVYA